MAPSISRGSLNRSIRSGWSIPSRRSPRRRTFSTPPSCRPRQNVRFIERCRRPRRRGRGFSVKRLRHRAPASGWGAHETCYKSLHAERSRFAAAGRMKYFRLYFRVLELLGREARLGWVLAVANLALASAMFVEPILFGRIVDTLASAHPRVSQVAWQQLMLLVGAWVAFGLFIILCGTLVALHADRLSHRQYQVVRTMFFEHVLQLPLSYHTGSHSGRLVKVMIAGTSTLWALWLSFFREHFASFISLIVLLPLTLFINWRYGLALIVLCAVFAGVSALVVSRVERLQSTVERYYTDVAERTTDTLGNIALVQSFARIETEVSGMRKLGEEALSAQIPVLSWWAVTTVITQASTTLTMLSILVLGVYFYLRALTTVGEIVVFMSFATLLITRLEQSVQFANRMLMDAPRLSEFFDVLDTEPAVRDRPDAVDPGRIRGLVEFKDVSFSYDGKRL